MVTVKECFGLAVLNLISAAAYAVTPAEAIEAGYAAGNVDWSAVTANRPASDAVAGMSGNTDALKALRDGGQAKLYAPGRSEADRCAKAGDPKCLAVQVVDRTGHAGSTVNPDVTGDLMKGYDDVVGSAEDRVDFDGTGNEYRGLSPGDDGRHAARNDADLRHSRDGFGRTSYLPRNDGKFL